jgi:hypothetical protein
VPSSLGFSESGTARAVAGSARSASGRAPQVQGGPRVIHRPGSGGDHRECDRQVRSAERGSVIK